MAYFSNNCPERKQNTAPPSVSADDWFLLLPQIVANPTSSSQIPLHVQILSDCSPPVAISLLPAHTKRKQGWRAGNNVTLSLFQVRHQNGRQASP